MLMSTLSPFEPPPIRVTKKKPAGNPVKPALLFLLKCVVFAVVFWTVWIFAVRPLDNADQLQARSEKLLARQEALLNRFEAVVAHWEAESASKK